MYDDPILDSAPFDFDNIADHLLEQGAGVSPSEIHGCLSGLLAAGAEEQAEFGLDAVGQTLDIAAHGELADEIMRLYQFTGVAMRDDDFTFDLLLPDDDTALDLRVQALAGWCSGFLAGIAHVSSRAKSAWSTDAREILEDIAAMSQVAIDDGESEDEAESNYIEIIEYLRFAVLNLFLENEGKASFSTLTRDPDEPLH